MSWWKENSGNLLTAGSGIIGSVISNVFNSVMQKRQNMFNAQQVDKQNAASAAEAEKAYQRSKPINQINNMRAAGVSDAQAAAALSGGGVYQPAPVNASQGQAPQIDLSSAVQAVQSAMQLKQEKQLAERSMKHEKDIQAKQLETQKEIAQLQADTTNRNADNRLIFDKEVFEYNKPMIQAQISKIKSATKLDEINVDSTELDNVRKRMEIENMPTLMKLANQETMTRINRMILDYQHAVENHTLDTEAKRLQNEITELTKDSTISFTNAKNELSAYMDEIHLRKNSKANGFFGSLELFLNNYMPAILKFK